jgi:ribosomal protein S18 acetylase RimI-like enzyme
MNLNCTPALEYSFRDLADLLNQSFAGYFMDINFTPASTIQLVQRDGVDLNASQVVLYDGQAIGCALIARRGWTGRLAAMGLASEHRGQGIGGWLLEQLLAQAQARRERAMVLEVIEQNEPAVRLYERAGFQRIRRLVGYRLSYPTGTSDPALEEVDLREVARVLTYYGLPDLPWQLAGESLAQDSLPQRGHRLGAAYAAISDPDRDHIFLKALVVPLEAQGQEAATRLLRALIGRYPDKTWQVPILWPEELAPGLFKDLSFVRESLTQLQMRLDLTDQKG